MDEAKQEPVAHMNQHGVIHEAGYEWGDGNELTSLYTHPAPVNTALQDIEQYRMQMAGICTAALGYWKEGDVVHPNYDTPALREVARLYERYRALRHTNTALLEALKTLVEHFEYYMGDNECRPLENARAAIAAAEGKV